MGILDTPGPSRAEADAKYLKSNRKKDSAILGKSKGTPKRTTDGRLGDSSDGDLIINGSLTITSDKAYADVRIGTAGVVTVARGVVITVSGETQNNGILYFQYTDGQNATGATGGLGGGVPTLGSGSAFGIGMSSGQAGVNGSTGVGANGVQAASKITHGGVGGTGGNGGASGATAGGTGATALAKTAPISGLRTVAQTFTVSQTTALATAQGGNGGGAGAGDGTNAGGGAGGAGSSGGMGIWLTNQLSGTGLFLAPGGKGGNGAAGVAGNAGGGGGGAGGGGGICIIAAHDSSKWAGTIGSPGGLGGSGGAGAGTGAAGTAGTAGTSGLAVLLSMNALKSSETTDIIPKFVPTGENVAALQTQQAVLGAMPVRFRGGPAEQITTGGNTYLKNGLYSPSSGYLGKNNGGAPWIMDYYSDAAVHSVGMLAGNGKYRLKVDGEWVNDYTVVPYSGVGGINWIQVSFSKRRQMRKFEWHLSSVPVRGLAFELTDTFYPVTEPLDSVRAFVGDSFTEGASGNVNASTWEMGSWAYRLAEKMGWDNIIVDAQGGTGYTNNGGASDGKKVYSQRITDDFTPLPSYMLPKQFIVAGGFNDGDATTLQAAAAQTFANIAAVAPLAFVDVVYFANTGSPAAGYLSGRTKVKTAALAAPNVRVFIDGITGEVTAGPACPVAFAPFVAMPFLTGSGYAGATNGTGNTDFLVSTDNIHPSYPEGHEYLALRVLAGLLMAGPR